MFVAFSACHHIVLLKDRRVIGFTPGQPHKGGEAITLVFLTGSF